MYPEFIAPPEGAQTEPQAPPSQERIRRYALLNEAARTAVDDLLEQAKAARLAQGLTQTELAARIGTSQRTISLVENGRQVPYMDTFVAHVLALGGQIILEFPGAESVDRAD